MQYNSSFFFSVQLDAFDNQDVEHYHNLFKYLLVSMQSILPLSLLIPGNYYSFCS